MAKKKLKTLTPATHPFHKKILLATYGNAGMAGQMILGVHEHANSGREWQFLRYNLDRISQEPPSKLVHDIADSDGAILQVGRLNIAITARQAWQKNRTPVVLLYGGRFHGGPPQVGVDAFMIGQMAAEHFLDRGFENFGYTLPVFPRTRGFATGRWAGFRNVLRQHGFRPSRLSRHVSYPPVEVGSRGTLKAVDRIIPWLAALPKPVAIFACDDGRASWVAEAAALLGLDVPEEVAILGVNNDEVCCLCAWPPISSIRLPARLIGFRAAELLGEMLAGKTPPTEPILLPPEGVEVRQSTDTTAVTDSRVAAAARYIRDHACEAGFTLGAVAENSAVSESHLFKLFHDHLKKTPFTEIRRVQLDNAKRLLVQTDRSIDQIGRECGFGSGSYLGKELRRYTNLTPDQYRKQFRKM